jgi:hypothetical protein
LAVSNRQFGRVAKNTRELKEYRKEQEKNQMQLVRFTNSQMRHKTERHRFDF